MGLVSHFDRCTAYGCVTGLYISAFSRIVEVHDESTNTDGISIPSIKREREGLLLVYLRSNITTYILNHSSCRLFDQYVI
jgi:hypothetical protein